MKSKPIYQAVREQLEPFGRTVVKSNLTREDAQAVVDEELRTLSEFGKSGTATFHVVPMRRNNNWRPVLGSLCTTLQKDGFRLLSVNNGDEDVEVNNDKKLALDELDATDESHLYVMSPAGKTLWLFIVLGNSPEETVCDYSSNPMLEASVDKFSKRWEGVNCPVKYVEDKWGR